ncbi:MAG: hypothetical protein J6J17_00430 [Bacilli bacterium]|nr:hypothetical protein [Bacilli bacterium]
MDKKIIEFKNNKNKIFVDGNLALKSHKEDFNKKNPDEEKYTAPKVKKMVFEKTNSKIVMGCWQQSYTSNGGDGC